MLSDTDPEAAKLQREVLDRMGPAGRFALMAELTDEVVALALAAIRRMHPSWNEGEVLAAFVEQNYGSELAEGFRKRLAEGTR